MKLVHALYEPPGDAPRPTILALHGWGANALDLLALAPHLCGGRFLTLCPQGSVETAIGPGTTGYGWFPFVPGGSRDMAALRAANDRLKAFIDEAQSHYPIDPKKFVVLGFSQGGALTQSLLFGDPGRFAAAAILSSWTSQELIDMFARPGTQAYPPVLFQHGLRDELIDVERARRSIELLRELRVPVTYREYAMGHEISPRSLADLSAWLEEEILSPIIAPL